MDGLQDIWWWVWGYPGGGYGNIPGGEYGNVKVVSNSMVVVPGEGSGGGYLSLP